MRDAIDSMWSRFHGTMLVRLEVLESIGLALLEGRSDPELWTEAHAAAHKLHGSLGTFGYARASVLAAEAETLLERSGLAPAEVYRFTEIVAELRAALEGARPRAAGSAADVEGADQPEVDAARPDGILGLAGARERLEALLGLAQRFESELSVVMMHVTGDDGLSDPRALHEMALTLSSHLRSGDFVAQRGESELIVALYGRSASEAAEWLEVAVAARSQGDVAPVAVIAQARGGGDARTLVAEADERMAEARRGGTERVAQRGEREVVDVVVVEDDEALGTLLVQALTDRGHSIRWLRDGMDAVRELTGTQPPFRARVVLLDVGLPGMDGLTVLRRLTQDGITRRTRVLMLTARSAEAEVVRALELGAFDHVPKPFSVSELAQRVRRALEDRKR